jgi:ParB family chromosome partitioning protein
VRMKKKEAIEAAEQALVGTGWLPSIMVLKG